jgi:DNA modification methylase
MDRENHQPCNSSPVIFIDGTEFKDACMKAQILVGDAISQLAQGGKDSVQCVVTSPPYWGLRDYGCKGQLGLEKTPELYIERMVQVFQRVRDVLRSDGTLWLNIGDSYAGSGKGGNPEDGKQATNKGSQSIGVLYGKTGESARQAAVTNVSRNLSIDAGYKPKDLIGIPWMLAFALRADGWYLRSDVIWAKPNGMPGSQEDRCTSSHEHVFLLSKSKTYFSDFDAIKTPPREASLIRLAQDVQAQAGSHRANGGAKTNGPMKAVGTPRNDGDRWNGNNGRGFAKPDKQRGHSRRHAGFNDRWDSMTVAEQQSMPATMRDVWFIPPANYAEAHFAVMPEELARRCILAGSKEGDTILDPFAGSGTTGAVAVRYHRNFVGIELNAEYAQLAENRINDEMPLFNDVSVIA